MAFVDYDDMVQAFSSYGTDQTLHIRILPGRSWRCYHCFDVETAYAVAKLGAVDIIAVTQQVPRSCVEREGLYDLLRSPLAGEICGHVEMHHSASVMGEDQKDEQHLEPDGRDSEEVDGHQVFDMVVQESSPGRRRAPRRRTRYFSTVDLATSMPS